MDICFDINYDMGMPESGTFIKTGRAEYLLFNNLRYQKKPIRSIVEELPVKITIHFADTGACPIKNLLAKFMNFLDCIGKD